MIGTKRGQIRTAWSAGDWKAALRIAAGIADLGEHDAAIKRAYQAAWNPNFQRQLQRDPDEVIALGIAALVTHFNLPEEPMELAELKQRRSAALAAMMAAHQELEAGTGSKAAVAKTRSELKAANDALYALAAVKLGAMP